MLDYALKPSEDFRKSAIKSVWAIALFVFTYAFLIIISITLTVVCCYLGIKLIEFYVNILTIMLGLGMIGFGFLILFFLIKFMFKSNKMDRSHLIEIIKETEPQLFKMIDEIVAAVHTDFPKKVYLSSEVNASVFYDSNFWSMFFPIRKNLQIGVGLINTTTIDELRAVLAHEFGHFSQKSLKIGSYVYNVNRIIHDILYDNEGYNQVARNIADSTSYFGIFVLISDKIVGLMQHILVQVYGVLNANYSKLSHEMEFHADAVAAHVVGSKPLITSLLRMQLANQALDLVLNYYDRKIDANIKTENVFPQQILAMNFLAKQNKLPIINEFPEVDLRYYNRFNKSKLSFSQEYSSHPETEERILRLEQINAPVKNSQIGFAINLISNKNEIAAQLTHKMFANVNYLEEPVDQNETDFEFDFVNQTSQNSFPVIFNEYFDYRNPFIKYTEGDLEKPVVHRDLNFDDLFGDKNLTFIYELNALESDWNTIDRLDSGLIDVKTFNYNGQKYSKGDCRAMLEYLNSEIQNKKTELENLDSNIFEYFRFQAYEQKLDADFKRLALSYQNIAEKFKLQQIVYADLANATTFMHTTTPFNIIKNKMVVVKKEEKKFKESLVSILLDEDYENSLSDEVRLRLEEYLKYDYKYFGADLYFDEELKVLFAAMADYADVITDTHFKAKKQLLEFEADLCISVLN
ncbi:M48 family metalloprotease [Pedobacter sp. Leaf250]|uniref:M48 family metalloprotease n=1 Tax=Pedobacter sp. Leaf250 TaxID=2876559 RepID=UPI001E5BAB8F|nr:M48 family metallopeptidase [Pedobacter sp. Leaf250]